MPEQITYTKLETQPARVMYGRISPFDMPTEVEQLAEWSGVSQDTVLVDVTGGTSNNLTVFYKNYLAQRFTISPSGSQIRVIRSITFSAWRTGTPPGDLIIQLREVDANGNPTSRVLASTRISQSELGTSAASYTRAFDRRITITTTRTLAVVFLQDAYLGDSSNCYHIMYWQAGTYGGGVLLRSTDAGATWTIPNSSWDVNIKINGDTPVKIYEGTINLAEVGRKAPASGRLNITVRARASPGANIRLYGVAGSACNEASTTSTSLTDLTVLSKDTDIPEQLDNMTWQVWATGSGLATRYTIQRYSYFGKKDITPKDFGASELYLAGYTLPPDSAFMINDEAGNIFANEGTTEVTSRMTENVYVKKISIIKGTPAIELLKVV